MQNTFCTYFDSRYLVRAIAMIESLRLSDNEAEVCVLCLDDLSKTILERMRLPRVRLYAIDQLISESPHLAAARTNRSPIEFIWTLTPFWIQFCSQYGRSKWAIYVDADLYFYSSLQPLYDEIEDASVAIIPHRFHQNIELQEQRSGKFNVGLVAVKADNVGSEVMEHWKACCLNSCSATPDGKLFGDQKYLDDWPVRFKGVHVVSNIGANLAPWNIAQYNIASEGGTLVVNGTPLVFYHFHGLALLGSRLAHTGFPLRQAEVELIYNPYLRVLSGIVERIDQYASRRQLGYSLPSLLRLARWIYNKQLTFLYAR